MSRSLRCLAVASALAAAVAFAEEPPAGRRASAPEKPEWEFAATGYWNAPRGGDDYASGIFAVDRGALHLEARANYEAVHAQSLFVGWTWSTGEQVKLDFTPIVGFVGGSLRGGIAGFESTVTAGRFDFYIEAEYVRDRAEGASNYTYAWSELGFRPVEWMRLGIVGQRTRIYGGEREIQRGGFAQVEWGKVTFSAYWFNPGSSDQVVIGAIGASF
jgi:hypothetical protein